LVSRGFVLDDIPVFGQYSVFNLHDVCNNPVRRQAGVGISPVYDDEVTFSYDESMLVFQ
jgi:hypothetical protein